MIQNELRTLPDKLLNEAIEALGFGLRFYSEHYTTHNLGILKQSIINFHRFSEFSLLYFIAKINPLLIFEKSFDGNKTNFDNPKTISFDKALNFYIHNLENGLINAPELLDPTKLKIALSKLKKLRNNIVHLFMPPDIDDNLHTEALELLYYIYLEENIHKIIEEKLSPDEQHLLNKLIRTEEAKLNKAYERVKDYQTNRLSHKPKEYNPDDAPVYECLKCDKKTLILSEENDSFFICTHCGNRETAGRCDVARACTGHVFTPICYLTLWNSEHGSMICDECQDLFESQLHSD